MTYGLVGDKVVNVVAALPPSDGQTTAEVSNKGTDEGVDDEVLGNGTVASIVRSEHDLMLMMLDLYNRQGTRIEDLPRRGQGRRPRSYTIHA